MTHKNWILSTVISIIVLQLCFSSCKKSPEIVYGCDLSTNLYDCHQKISWDSIKMNQALIGTWDWQLIGCYFKTKIESCETYKGFSVEFKADHTLITRQDGIATDTVSWQLVQNPYNSYTLELNPFVGQLKGIVYFCDDRVEFSDSYVDGCDNYFIRKK